MSIESITTRIQKEAEAYSDEQRTQAEAEKEKILEEARAQADSIKKRRAEEAKRDAATVKSRKESVAGLDSRQMVLAAKQELIEESFEGAIEKIRGLDADDYVAFIKEQLEPFKDDEGEVLLSAEDKEKYGSRLQKELKGTKLSVSDDTAEIRGGCILRKGNISYNASIEELLGSMKNELTTEVAGILFR